MIICDNLGKFFQTTLEDLKTDYIVKTYIINIYKQYQTSTHDLSKDNLTLLFAQAANKKDFSAYQNLGDWLFYTKSLFPESLNNASETYYNSIAQISYYNCYRIVREWQIYEKLSDEFDTLTKESRKLILNQNP